MIFVFKEIKNEGKIEIDWELQSDDGRNVESSSSLHQSLGAAIADAIEVRNQYNEIEQELVE